MAPATIMYKVPKASFFSVIVLLIPKPPKFVEFSVGLEPAAKAQQHRFGYAAKLAILKNEFLWPPESGPEKLPSSAQKQNLPGSLHSS
jgi:hypothetical protein